MPLPFLSRKEEKMCNYKCSHRVETITATATNLVLTVSESTNISNYERFDFYFPCYRSIGSVVTGDPLPVQVNINGVVVDVLNRFGEPLQSNRVPRRSKGTYIVPETGDPYLILHNTPFCNPRL
ncbi:MAG: hypothetical protein IKY15_02745 [Clostridia bacterium]|nr:hypothetical protein [Clostridia bacterium]